MSVASDFDAIRDRLDAAGLPYLGPARVQVELLVEPLRIMDDRTLG